MTPLVISVYLLAVSNDVMELLLTVFIIGDGDGDNITGSHHGAAPVVTQWRPKMHLELLLRLENRIVIDVNGAVLHLGHKHTMWCENNLTVNTANQESLLVFCCIQSNKAVINPQMPARWFMKYE